MLSEAVFFIYRSFQLLTKKVVQWSHPKPRSDPRVRLKHARTDGFAYDKTKRKEKGEMWQRLVWLGFSVCVSKTVCYRIVGLWSLSSSRCSRQAAAALVKNETRTSWCCLYPFAAPRSGGSSSRSPGLDGRSAGRRKKHAKKSNLMQSTISPITIAFQAHTDKSNWTKEGILYGWTSV